MAKRPEFDLASLTAGAAEPMQEAAQRNAQPDASPTVAATPKIPKGLPKQPKEIRRTKTEELEPLAFKVSPEFRRRFRQRAFAADLKLNELLFAALNAWEEKNRIK